MSLHWPPFEGPGVSHLEVGSSGWLSAYAYTTHEVAVVCTGRLLLPPGHWRTEVLGGPLGGEVEVTATDREGALQQHRKWTWRAVHAEATRPEYFAPRSARRAERRATRPTRPG